MKKNIFILTLFIILFPAFVFGKGKALSPEDAASFYSVPINDEIFARMKGKSYKDDCRVPVEELRYIHILHKNIQGQTLQGEMVCNKAIAPDLLEIFKELYLSGYPIEKMQLVDDFDADDETSMSADNSSSFNYRLISGTNRISNHGMGMAVDINPLYNPYVVTRNGKSWVEPSAGFKYVDRSLNFNYKIVKDDLCCKLFIQHGFEWGGDWDGIKDYQHFEKEK